MIQIKQRYGLLLLGCFMFLQLLGCTEMDNATVRYGDGSGNSYIISPKPTPQIMYQPVKPEFSSSGEYDGGTPVTHKLTAAEHNQILAVLRAALENPAVHITQRVKMSGLISIKSSDKEASFILKPGCAEQQAIEKLLKQTLGR